MNYGRLVEKAEAIVATGMPGFYRVIAFLCIQRVYSIGDLGSAASAFSVAQILAFFTAIGWASLILVRIPAARDRSERIQRFYELVRMGSVSVALIGACTLLWSHFFFRNVSGPEIVAILSGWTLYQLCRHYYLAQREYRRVVIYDFVLLAATAVLIVGLHRLGVAAGWTLGVALAIVGGLMLLNIGPPRQRLGSWTFELKGLEFGFTNFLSGGVALSLVPIANLTDGASFAGVISLIASFSAISALIPRAISMYRLPELSRLVSVGEPLVKLTMQTAREITLASGATFLINGVIVLAIVSYEGTRAQFWYALICGLVICAQGCISMLGMAHSSVLMVREASRDSVIVNLASCSLFVASVGLFYLTEGHFDFSFVLAACVAVTIFRNRMLKRRSSIFLASRAVANR
ncbi:hypothetical protein AB4Y45_11765 [Paraburkholderia sp. EG287A]|uniref:hypothetical protein n=1 Tax=unclassified Paraburkholderia TaxID=2615204 RepID=UPI0034D295BB